MTSGFDDRSPRTVLLDVDGTLASNTPRLIEYTAMEYGIELAPEEITEWSYEIPAIDRHVGELISEALADRPEWFLLGMDPIDGAADASAWFIDRGHTVKIATHRPPETHPITEQWLSTHGIPYDDIVHEVPPNKGELVGDLLIDDYHGNVQNAIENGMAGGLFEQPYSDPSAVNGAAVADNWTDMLSAIRDSLDA